MAHVKLTHAKLAKFFVHAPGLFRNFKKGERNKQSLDIEYESGDVIFRFVSGELLDATDLRVLQGIIAVATGTVHQSGGVRKLLREGRTERHKPAMKGNLSPHRIIAVHFTLLILAAAIGYTRPGGATRSILRESIKRLSGVTVFVERCGRAGSYQLISDVATDAKTGELIVGLSPDLANSVLRKNNFLRLSIDEIKNLKSDAARLIHSRLHWINQGTSSSIGLEKLCAYVYADEPTTIVATKKRRREVRDAMLELTWLGWGVSKNDNGVYAVIRPPANSRTLKSPVKNESEQVPPLCRNRCCDASE